MKRVEQAGGVVFRRRSETIEILLVRSKKDPSIWVFPKGHVEPGESLQQTALRETREEAGVDGEPLGPVGPPLEFTSGSEAVRVHYFLIRATRTVDGAEPREKRWFEADAARMNLSFDTARELLDAACSAITALPAKR
jgi:diadenosine hexaphosphate hydrolase (ATP-forming)